MPIAAAVLLAFVSAVPVAAGSSVSVFGCYLRGGVEFVVPGEVAATGGWAATSRGLVQAFLTASTWTVTVDDAPVDITDSFGPLTRRDDGTWAVSWEYPAGTLAGPGDQLAVRVQLSLTHTVFDGADFYRPEEPLEFECTIIAV
jgi:hypothetical protein